jgi:hypothetical protein
MRATPCGDHGSSVDNARALIIADELRGGDVKAAIALGKEIRAEVEEFLGDHPFELHGVAMRLRQRGELVGDEVLEALGRLQGAS